MGEVGGGVPHRRTSPRIFSNSHELRHNQTEAESQLWKALRGHGLNDIHFRRQHAIGNYVVDFCAPQKKLIIEVDGGLHLDQQEYDGERSAFLESKGYQVLRFWNSDVINNMDGVIWFILETLGSK
jgi:very-short-patch-repair endonuclease